jgi:Tfp pilus assembly protein PilF/peroxiredoxin
MKYNNKYTVLVLQTIIFIGILTFSFAYTATAQALLQIGTDAPAFSLKDIDGKETDLSQFSQKKATVIVFWSTWSSKSSKALKKFEEFYEKYKHKGIQIIGINVDKQIISNDDLENIRKFIKDHGLTFPILIDRGLNTFHNYNVIALPSILVVSEGKISYELPGLPLVGTENLFDYLLVLAGETPHKKAEPKYKPSSKAIADTNLAKGFVKKKMHAIAYSLFNKAIEADPKYMLPYIELARLYASENKNTEAEETLKKALSAEPENVAVMSELGCLLSRTGKIKDAIEILNKAAGINSYTPAHYYYAYALAKQGQLKESLSAFDHAISLNPYETSIYILRAEVYEDSKMLKEASSDYKKAIELILKIKN